MITEQEKEQKTKGKKEIEGKQRGDWLCVEHKAEVYQKKKKNEKPYGT